MSESGTQYDSTEHVKTLRGVVENWKEDPQLVADYLKWTSNFTDYTPFNRLMIFVQDPTATRVAAAGKWRSLGRSIIKGEKHRIRVFRSWSKNWTEEDENGEEIRRGVFGYNSKAVFDISQTEGDELPEVVVAPKIEAEGIARLNRIAELVSQIEKFTFSTKLMDPSVGWINASVEGGTENWVVNSAHPESRQAVTRINAVSNHLYSTYINDEQFTNSEVNWIAGAATWMVSNRNGIDIDQFTGELLDFSRTVGEAQISVLISQAERLGNLIEALEEGVPIEWATAWAQN